MADIEDIAVRVSVLEFQMVALTEAVEEIRANYVTKQYLEERLVSFKVELMAELNPRFAELTVAIDQCATKEALHQMEQRLRNWMLGLFFTLFFSLSGLQLAMFQLFLRH